MSLELPPLVVVTGCNGGLGRSICERLTIGGFEVVGIDLAQRPSTPEWIARYFEFDLGNLVGSAAEGSQLFDWLAAVLSGRRLVGLVNNAATQVVGNIQSIDVPQWQRVFGVNVAAPFFLAKYCFPILKMSGGSIVNVSSVHARASKPGFALYATSKAALSGLTRAMALEWGAEVPVYGLEPGAIDTEMLRAGFIETPDALAELEKFQPLGTILLPDEIAKLVEFLVKATPRALSGAMIEAGGGIAARLHDPI